MKLNITEFYNKQLIVKLSNNVKITTWEHNHSFDYLILDNEDKLEAFRLFIQLRGWNEQVIAKLTSNELNELCIQWVASDIQKSILGNSNSDPWLLYEELCRKDLVSGRLFNNDGVIYFDLRESI